ncbi:MAG: acyl-CoA dehydrogenase family protein [Rhodococcus sp. (in: high G+C Gram-positive bacteria)]
MPEVLTDDSVSDADFASHVRNWLQSNLTGDFGGLRGKGGPGREHEAFEERREWDRHLAASGWTCLGWPVEFGGAGLSLRRQVIFHEEYARADAPARAGHIGEELLGPTLIAFGDAAQQERFLPAVLASDVQWCQGYSEPGAGSDLASVSTSARLDGDRWHINGQKIWTSLAHLSDWCFVLARSEPGSVRHRGLSYLLVPLKDPETGEPSPGIDIRPIRHMTGTSEFNEVFFDDATTDADLVVGEPGSGWSVAMGTLELERGVSTLGQQVGFARELSGLVELARKNGALDDPAVADRLSRAWLGLRAMRAFALASLEGVVGPGAPNVSKLLWGQWHRGLGELAMDIIGAPSAVADDGELDQWQRLYLFSRADTIYGGSDEVQRNIIAERALGLPREARP